ncbi:MAG: hypothetical protein LLG04_00435, partial [Parachlamydia sp.]|nr:hypothetical protein [Parachlamydia sp.]
MAIFTDRFVEKPISQDQFHRSLPQKATYIDTYLNQCLAHPVTDFTLEEQFQSVIDHYFYLLQGSPKFSLKDFIRDYVPQEHVRTLLEKLSWKLRLGDWDFNYLSEKPTPRLEGFAFQTLAEILPPQALEDVLSRLNGAQRLALAQFCYANYREGSFFILASLEERANGHEKELYLKLRLYVFDRKKFAELDASKPLPELINVLQKHVEKQIDRLMPNLEKTGLTREEIEDFVSIFGFDDFLVLIKEDFHLIEMMPIADIKQESFFYNKEDYEDALRGQIGRIKAHCEAAKKPEIYAAGLKLVTWALPTAGKRLAKMAWIPSVAQGLKSMIDYLNKKGVAVSPQEHPLIVFDQSPPDIFQENREFIKTVEQKTGIPIVHLSRQQVVAIAEKIGVKEMVVTTKDGVWGYGGARNSIYCIASIIKELKGQNRWDQWEQVPPDELKSLFKHLVLEDRAIVFMGDDDTEVPAANLFEEALISHENQSNNFKKVCLSIGRDTTPQAPPGKYADDRVPLDLAALCVPWKTTLLINGMNGNLSKPRFCLTLPYGAEENTGVSQEPIKHALMHPHMHLAGNRAPEGVLPTKPYSGITQKLRQVVPYVYGNYEAGYLKNVIPWDREKFYTFGEALSHACSPYTQSALQTSFWSTFAEHWKLQPVHYTQSMQETVFDVFRKNVRIQLMQDESPTRQKEVEEFQQFQAQFQTLKRDLEIAQEL